MAHECRRDQERQRGEQLHARLDRLQQPATDGDVVGEQRLPHEIGTAGDGLLDEAPPAAPSDAPARAQADLAAQEPFGRGGCCHALAPPPARRRPTRATAVIAKTTAPMSATPTTAAAT